MNTMSLQRFAAVSSLIILAGCLGSAKEVASCAIPFPAELYGGSDRLFAPGVDSSGLPALRAEFDLLCAEDGISEDEYGLAHQKLQAMIFDTAALRMKEQAAVADSLDALQLVEWNKEDLAFGFVVHDELQPNPVKFVSASENGRNAVVLLTRSETKYPVESLSWKDRCGYWHWALRNPDPNKTTPEARVQHYTEQGWTLKCSDFEADRKKLLELGK